jgi:dynactin complex subunit
VFLSQKGLIFRRALKLFFLFLSHYFSTRHEAKIAYIGDVHYAKGVYVGVIMKDPSQGKNNGIIRGVEYFKCKAHEKGLMLPISEVTLIK